MKLRRPHRIVDLTGKVFGRLTVIRLNGLDAHGKSAWVCRCSCGKEKINSCGNLNGGRVRSCGCLKREQTIAMFTTHGRGNNKSREYRIWSGMRNRCNNQKSAQFKDYGARGIKVCDRWNSFKNFLADMGECPSGLSIERKDNALGYSPDNCVWAGRKQQCNNRRSNRFIVFRAQKLTLTQWSERIGVNPTTLRNRLAVWPLEKALTSPSLKQQQ